MTNLRRAILTITILGTVLTTQGFRSHQSTGDKIIQLSEDTFRVESQVEHFRSLIINPDLSVETGDLVLIYSYEVDKVYGIVHMTKSGSSDGYTVLSIQETGKLPKLYLWEPGFEKVKELRASDWRGRFAGTPWNFEDMLNDDMQAWTHTNKGMVLVNGEAASMVESTYEDPELKRRSAYQKRQNYIAKDDKRFLQSVFYNRNGAAFKTFRATLHKNYGTEENPLLRGSRLEVIDHETGLMALLQIEDADYDVILPKAFFDPASLPTWSEKELPRAMELARGNTFEES